MQGVLLLTKHGGKKEKTQSVLIGVFASIFFMVNLWEEES